MNMNVLKEGLRPWMRVDSWNSRHSCDDERFYKALQNVFSELGESIDGFQFEEAISELANEYYSDCNQTYLKEIIHEFALKAELIAGYAHYIKTNQSTPS